MTERRREMRQRVIYGGAIAFDNHRSTVECAVRDFRPTGRESRSPATSRSPITSASCSRKKTRRLRRGWCGAMRTRPGFRSPGQLRTSPCWGWVDCSTGLGWITQHSCTPARRVGATAEIMATARVSTPTRT